MSTDDQLTSCTSSQKNLLLVQFIRQKSLLGWLCTSVVQKWGHTIGSIYLPKSGGQSPPPLSPCPMVPTALERGDKSILTEHDDLKHKGGDKNGGKVQNLQHFCSENWKGKKKKKSVKILCYNLLTFPSSLWPIKL